MGKMLPQMNIWNGPSVSKEVKVQKSKSPTQSERPLKQVLSRDVVIDSQGMHKFSYEDKIVH